jgi:hypothetical protein
MKLSVLYAVKMQHQPVIECNLEIKIMNESFLTGAINFKMLLSFKFSVQLELYNGLFRILLTMKSVRFQNQFN